MRLHEGFATDLGLELHPNEDPAAAGMTPISFRVLCYAPQGFHHISPTPDAGTALCQPLHIKLCNMLPHLSQDAASVLCIDINIR